MAPVICGGGVDLGGRLAQHGVGDFLPVLFREIGVFVVEFQKFGQVGGGRGEAAVSCVIEIELFDEVFDASESAAIGAHFIGAAVV